MENVKNKKILITIISLIIILILTLLYFIKDEKKNYEEITYLTTTKEITTNEMIFVDIKGDSK